MIEAAAFVVETIQTGVRVEKRLLKALKAFAESHGKTPFGPGSLNQIKDLKRFNGLELVSTASHRLKEAKRPEPSGAGKARRLVILENEMKPPSDHELMDQFERATLPLDCLHHPKHVHVASLYLMRGPVLEALQTFSVGLRRFATRHGKSKLYHETITWAYRFLIHEGISRTGRTQGWEDFVRDNSDLLIWKNGALSRLYREELAASGHFPQENSPSVRSGEREVHSARQMRRPRSLTPAPSGQDFPVTAFPSGLTRRNEKWLRSPPCF